MTLKSMDLPLPNPLPQNFGRVSFILTLKQSLHSAKMARGQQKVQSQQKNAEKKAKMKKASSQLKAAGAALVHSCTVCKVYASYYLYSES